LKKVAFFTDLRVVMLIEIDMGLYIVNLISHKEEYDNLTESYKVHIS